MMKKILTFLLLAGLFTACHSHDPYKKARDIYEQTMKIHDQVMPKMGEILSVKHNLKGKLDSVSDPLTKSHIDSAMASLDKTYNDMMEWMGKLQPIPNSNKGNDQENMDKPDEVPSPDQMEKIQQESLQRIKTLQGELEKSLQEGKDLLNKN